MGDARRRKQAGEYPEQDGGDVASYRMPAGMIGVTLDVDGTDPTTVAVASADLMTMMTKVGETFSDIDYYDVVRCVLRDYRRYKAESQSTLVVTVGMVCLWTILNHPKGGPPMRRQVSKMLRETNTAHLTWSYAGNRGLAIGVSDRFVDLTEVSLATRAAGIQGSYVMESQTAEEPAH